MTSKLVRSIVPVVIGIATLSSPGFLRAQAVSSLVTNRLTQPIDESARVTLRGTVHPLANRANDRGAAPDSMPLERIQIVLQRSAAQESTLQQLIHDEHTKGTANYHKWLTPAQFGQQFGPSDQDIATLESWLESKGFNIEKVNPGKLTLEISGNVAQFRSAFNAQIHKYVVNGETHYANAGDPQIPAALAPVFGGFASLNNFRPRRFSHVLGQASYNPKTGQATPQWTTGTSSALNFVLAPSDFAVQYDLPAASSGINGSGQTIAIINDSNINIALVNQFRTLFGLPANPPQVIIDGNDPGIDGINNPDGPNGDSIEAYLDVEWSGAVAPQATVDLVVGADTSLENGFYLAAEHAVYGNIAPVMSLSFGNCEASLGTFNQFLNALWQQAAAQGITVMVSTGDNGSAGCDDDSTQYYAVNGAAVSGLASTPYNVAIGGTDFYYSGGVAGIATYWNQTPSQNPSTSIIKAPIPEQPWNDSQYGLNIFSIYDESEASGNPQTSIAGGSGGASTLYSKPAWQTGTGVPNDSHRDIPDVSLFAANGLNASYYPICYADGDCQPASGSNLIQITGIGGTSASSPAFAGIMALVNQKYGRQGQANYVLYPLAKQYPAAFHDVTNGTNSVPCAYSATSSLNTPDCIAVSNPITVTDPNLGAAEEGQIGSGTTVWWNATPGYDLASGLGSVDASVLINDWSNVKFTSSTVSLTSPTAGSTFTHGTAVNFKGTVTATGGSTPAGSVAIETDSTEPGQQAQGFPGLFNSIGSTITPSTLALTSGSFNGSISTLPGGTYNVWASYGGDGTNGAAQSSPAQITVSPEASSVYFAVNDVATGRATGMPAISSGATNVPYGTQLILSAQPVPSSQLSAFTSCQTSGTCPSFTTPTGTVAFSDNGTAINTAVLNAEGDAEYNSAFAVGSHSATAKYSGDSSYNSSTSSAITFSIVKDTPNMNLTTTIQASSGVFIQGQQNVITVVIQNSANLANESNFQVGYSVPAAAPTGTVTATGLPSGTPTSATLAAGVDAQSSAPVGIATFIVPSTAASGNYNIAFTYAGDGNYNSATQSDTIGIQGVGGVATTTTATITGSISPTTSISLSGTVTGKSGDPAPSNNMGQGGVMIYTSGYYFIIPVTPGTGDSSTFSTVLNSQSLLQGANSITVQYLGDSTYAPSAMTLTPPISNPLSDFSMVPETTIVDVPSSGTATDTINVSSVNGFAGAVNITCTPASGIICTLNPASPNLSSGGTSAVTLNIDGTNVTTAGNYNVLVTGTDSTGKFVHTLGLEVIAPVSTAPPGFSITPASGTVNVNPGSTGNDNLAVSPSGGFTGTVNLACAVSGGPSGATSPPTCTAAPNPTVAFATVASSTMSVATTSSTTAGTYTATITGTSGSLTANATASIVVSSTPAGFALTNSAGITIASPGATTGNTSTLTVTPAGGFTGSVNFTCTVTTSPSGATAPPTCSAPAANVTGTAAATSILTVTTTAATSGALHRPLDKFFAASGGIAIAALLFFGIPARRRNWRSMIAVILFAGLVSLGIGCGGSSGGGGGGGGSGGTTTGAYVLTVTATDAATGKISSTATVNVTVN